MVRELKKKLGAAETVLAARESSAEVVDDGTDESAAAEVEADVSALGEDFAEMTALTEEAGVGSRSWARPRVRARRASICKDCRRSSSKLL